MRTHARIRLDMWSDDDYRDLTSGAQWLYEFLLSAPATSFAGVHPWRPGTIAGHAADLSAFDVEHFAAELEDGRFLVIDRSAEECLIRSFIKHDGLMGSPNMVKALIKSHAEIGSPALRGVIVHELKRLKRAKPSLKGWPNAGPLLNKRGISPEVAIAGLPANPARVTRLGERSEGVIHIPDGARITPSDDTAPDQAGRGGNPSGNPSVKGSVNPSGNTPRTPILLSSLTPTSSSSSPSVTRAGGE